MFTLEIGGDVRGNHRRLHQEGAHATHRVGQGAAFGSDARPAGTDQDRRRQVFLERRGALLQAVAALVQAVAGEVQGEDGFAAVQAQVDAQVGVELVHRRALAGRSAQLVDNGVLDLQGAEVGVVDARAMAAELHGQGAVGQHVVLPVDIQHAVVEILGVLHREALEHQQHPVGQARPQAQAIGRLHVGHAAHGRSVLTRLLKAKPDGFLDQQAFKAFGTGEEDFVTIRHGNTRAFSNK